MRYIFLLFFITSLYSTPIEIEAEFFEADEKNALTTLSGNVKVSRGLDVMKADEMLLHLDAKHQISFIEANTNSYIEIHLDKNVFIGSAKKFSYEPKKEMFILLGDARLEDNNGRVLLGETIIFNEQEKKATVVGQEKQPVKLIFNTESK